MTKHHLSDKQRGVAGAGTDSPRTPPKSDGGSARPSPQGESERVVQMGDKQPEERRSRIGDFR